MTDFPFLKVDVSLEGVATCADGQVDKGSHSRRHSKTEHRISEWRDVLQVVEASGTKFIFVLESRSQLELWMAAIKKQMIQAKSPEAFPPRDARKLSADTGDLQQRESIKRSRKLLEEIVRIFIYYLVILL